MDLGFGDLSPWPGSQGGHGQIPDLIAFRLISCGVEIMIKLFLRIVGGSK